MEAFLAKHEVPMQSWQLFKHLTPFRASEIEFSPIFQRERQRSPAIWMLSLPPRLAQVSLPAALLIGIAYVVGLLFVPVPLATYCLSALAVWPILALPSLGLWALPLGLTLAPVVVRERVAGTWNTLRLTPLDTETILLGKARAALLRIRPLLIVFRAVLVGVSLIAAMVSLNLIEHITHTYPSLPPLNACGVGTLVMLLTAFVFLIDRAQQFVLMAIAALAVSASSASERLTLPGANAAALLVWMADVGAVFVVFSLHPGGAAVSMSESLPLLVMLGPVAGYTGYLSPGFSVLFVIMTLLVRETAIRLLWRWTITAACRA
jgi:hypothetical protein